MSPLDLILLALLGGLAVWQAVETVHHGTIFQGFRDLAARNRQARGDLSWGAAVLCPFCLSHWIAAVIAACIYLGTTWAPIFLGPPLWLAIVRIANLLNDLSYGITRTPKAREVVVDVGSGDRTSPDAASSWKERKGEEDQT